MHVDGNNGTENVQQKPTITEQFDNLTKDVGQSDYQLANNLAGLNETVNRLSQDVNKKINLPKREGLFLFYSFIIIHFCGQTSAHLPQLVHFS